MVKKVLVGILFAALIGFLVVGAINRTLDRTERVVEAQGEGQGRGEGNNPGSRGQGNGGYLGQDGKAVYSYGAGQADVGEWLPIQGMVTSVGEDGLVVQVADGTRVAMENRVWWFTQSQGFEAQVGDQVVMVGFWEGEDFKAGQIDNLSNESGQSLQVRDVNGRPLWAGGGRGGRDQVGS